MAFRFRSAAGRHSRPQRFRRHETAHACCFAHAALRALALLTCLTWAVIAVGCDSQDDESSTRPDNPGNSPPGDDPVVDPPGEPPHGSAARITSLVPGLASEAGGTVVTIATTGFADDFTAAVPTVTFASVASGNVAAIDSTSLTAVVPALPAGDVDVQVVGSALSGNAGGFRIVAPAAPGEVILNEVLPNPGGLDANRDGGASNLDDEFVELVNARATPVDLSGYTLRDASAVRHTFANPTTIPAGGSLVLFGAGNVAAASPAFAPAHASGHAVTASTGGLSLNNGGDTVTLAAPSTSVVDTVTVAAAVAGVSANRNPDGDANAALAAHGDVPGSAPDAVSGGGYSPGLRVDQSPW